MAAQDALPAGTVVGKGAYEITQVLGQGGFAITYLACETGADRLVAIKEFFPLGSRRQGTVVTLPSDMDAATQESAERKFLGEARVLSELRHPNIVSVSSTFEENETAYMVMELLEGKTLHELVEESKPARWKQGTGALAVDTALSYIEQVADALRVVHEAHYIHRDVKPENIMVCGGRAVLLDFGLNKQLASAANQGTMMLTTGLRFGSPGYSPPEQYGQQNRFGPYTDIYSLGATLYFLLTGVVPEEAPERMYGGDLTPVRQLNRKVSQAVSDAVMWAMQLRGDQRPQSVDEFLQALHQGRATAPAAQPTVAQPAAAPAAAQTTVPASGRRLPRPSALAAGMAAGPAAAGPDDSPPTPATPAPGAARAPAMAPTMAHTAGYRVGRAGFGRRMADHFKSGFRDILPRLILLAAIIAALVFAARRQRDEGAQQAGHKAVAHTAKARHSQHLVLHGRVAT